MIDVLGGDVIAQPLSFAVATEKEYVTNACFTDWFIDPLGRQMEKEALHEKKRTIFFVFLNSKARST